MHRLFQVVRLSLGYLAEGKTLYEAADWSGLCLERNAEEVFRTRGEAAKHFDGNGKYKRYEASILRPTVGFKPVFLRQWKSLSS